MTAPRGSDVCPWKSEAARIISSARCRHQTANPQTQTAPAPRASTVWLDSPRDRRERGFGTGRDRHLSRSALSAILWQRRALLQRRIFVWELSENEAQCQRDD